MAAVHGLLRYTKLGKAMRATAANRSLARNCGIRTDRVVTVTWALTGALCGMAGTVLAINDGSFGATSADLFLVVILAAVFLGGPGQAYGAMVGAAHHRAGHRDQRGLHQPVVQVRGRLRCAADRDGGAARRRAGGDGLMTSAQLFYVINLLVYAGVDIIACLGLSQQFGVAGITNFGFIIFQAAGAYTAAILSLPSQTRQRRVPVLHRRAGTCRARSPGSAR